MPWQDIMRRVLPPTRGVSPHITSAYGALREVGTSPHRGVDFNYYVGPKGQSGINLQQPALRSPVDGVVENAGEGTLGKIAIRDKNGFLHEILHTHSRHVAIGDPVAAGQLIGTMGNTGVKKPNGQPGDHHVHYQMWDPAGNPVNPTDFWDRQGLADSDPSPPAYLDEYNNICVASPMRLMVLATYRAGRGPATSSINRGLPRLTRVRRPCRLLPQTIQISPAVCRAGLPPSSPTAIPGMAVHS